MEALLLAGGKAERLGEAAQGLPKPLVPVGGFPLAEYTVARLVERGVTRIIVACRAGQTRTSSSNALAGLGAEIEPVGETEPLGRGGGLRFAASHRRESGPVLALNGDELLDVDFASARRRARAERRGGDDRRRAGALAVRRRRPRGGRHGHRLPRGAAARALGELRRLRPRRGGARAAARSAATTSSRPSRELAAEGKLRGHRHTGVWLTVNTPKDLRRATEFMEEHPDWKPHRQRMSIDSPNYGSLDRFSFEPRRVEKPWGWELIWADRRRVRRQGLVRHARASRSRSSSTARRTRAGTSSRGRARLELGDVGQEALDEEVVTGRRVLPLPPRHRSPRDRDRGHDDPRGLDAASRRRRPARGPLRPRGHQRTLSVFSAGTVASTSAISEGCRSKAAARRRSASSSAPTRSAG